MSVVTFLESQGGPDGSTLADIERLAVGESEHRARAMLDALPAAVYTTDAEGRITYYNQAAVVFSGREPVIGSDSWCVSWKLFQPDGTPMPHDECPMALALRRRTPSHGEYEAVAERPDGTRVPFIPYATPLFGRDGALTGGINMLVDISERKKAEEHQLLMINELNHRVKNTLAVVQSLAHLTLRNDTTPGALRDFEARLHAMSAAHDVLTSRNWVGAPLTDLVRRALDPHCAHPDCYTATGPDIDLPPQTAVALSMALHELCTNAIKHGSLSAAGTGSVDVAWTCEDDRLSLTWTERGGPPVSPPTRRGFGVQMLERALAHEFHGSVTLDFAPEGLRCHIAGPLKPA
ncbi:MAG: PAS domain S-box protein [Caulobacterales bacterium]|nr:PAS domain S-box protein [Caulobacterales bacterium]